MASSLHGEIIADILRLARDEGWPAGAPVGEKPLAARLGALAIGFAVFLLARRSVLAAVLGGEAAIVAAGWWWG